MKKLILSIALLTALGSSAFADLVTLKATNTAKTTQLKMIRQEMKQIREQVRIVKLEEKSKKLDQQIITAQQKLAEMRSSLK